jgi:cobalt/nickel transport system permease protein
MHIADGLVSAPICLGSYGLTGLLTWATLHQVNQRVADPTRLVPPAALLTAAFFVASLIHVPIPPASVHFLLNGLVGIVLGYLAFPAVLIGLFLQAVIFGHGGLSTLGINALIIGFPALVAAAIFQLRQRLTNRHNSRLELGIFAFLASTIAVGLATLLFFGIAVTGLSADLDADLERKAIGGLALAHVPLMLIEGSFTALIVLFLDRVKPELLRTKW